MTVNGAVPELLFGADPLHQFCLLLYVVPLVLFPAKMFLQGNIRMILAWKEIGETISCGELVGPVVIVGSRQANSGL